MSLKDENEKLKSKFNNSSKYIDRTALTQLETSASDYCKKCEDTQTKVAELESTISHQYHLLKSPDNHKTLLDNLELANAQLRVMMEQKIERISTLEKSLHAAHKTVEDLRSEIQVLESEADLTMQLEESQPKESLGHQLYEFLKEDPLKRIKFIRMLQDFEEFEYNYSKIDSLAEIKESEQMFTEYFNPEIMLYLDCEDEKTELKAIIEQLQIQVLRELAILHTCSKTFKSNEIGALMKKLLGQIPLKQKNLMGQI